MTDDYDWNTYTEVSYEPQLSMFLKQGDFNDNGKDMILKKFSIKNNKIFFEDNLHPNWKEIYNQFNNLNPNSVFEVGCGCGHHLINIHKINNNVEINGCDYSQSQINLGKKYFNMDKYPFFNKLFVQDFSILNHFIESKYEFVYTHAVTMHLSYTKAKNMLINMGKLSSKYIFFIENYGTHDYNELLKESLPNYKIIHTPNNEYDFVPYYLLQRQ